jgi:hypothetical protein
MALPAHSGPWPLFSFIIRNFFFTDGRTPWASDQSIARPLHTEQHKHIPNIHALSGIRTHDPSVRASEDSSCLRSRGYCDRLAFERAKTVYAFDLAATVTGCAGIVSQNRYIPRSSTYEVINHPNIRRYRPFTPTKIPDTHLY